jgi:hypothetical protein
MNTQTSAAYSEEVQTLRRETNKQQQRPKTVGGVSHRMHQQQSSRANPDQEWKRIAQAAGINTEFPGTTEMKATYTRPPVNNYKNFVMNPQMELHKISRPFTAAAHFPHSTEYQTNYRIPDGNLIDKFPWIKQY